MENLDPEVALWVSWNFQNQNTGLHVVLWVTLNSGWPHWNSLNSSVGLENFQHKRKVEGRGKGKEEEGKGKREIAREALAPAGAFAIFQFLPKLRFQFPFLFLSLRRFACAYKRTLRTYPKKFFNSVNVDICWRQSSLNPLLFGVDSGFTVFGPFVSLHLANVTKPFLLFAFLSRYEDRGALDGGENGLDVVKKIVESCEHLLKDHG